MPFLHLKTPCLAFKEPIEVTKTKSPARKDISFDLLMILFVSLFNLCVQHGPVHSVSLVNGYNNLLLCLKMLLSSVLILVFAWESSMGYCL